VSIFDFVVDVESGLDTISRIRFAVFCIACVQHGTQAREEESLTALRVRGGRVKPHLVCICIHELAMISGQSVDQADLMSFD